MRLMIECIAMAYIRPLGVMVSYLTLQRHGCHEVLSALSCSPSRSFTYSFLYVQLTQVLANVLNLNVLSNPSPLAVNAHLPPAEVSSGARLALRVSSSEPLEKFGSIADEKRVALPMSRTRKIDLGNITQET